MTLGLAKAAAANKDLTVGKEVQKMFIPLEKNTSGKKLTTGKKSRTGLSFLVITKGQRVCQETTLTTQNLTRITTRSSSAMSQEKGFLPLIMVEVATIFLNYFRHWKTGSRIYLPELIININDLLEERGFQGRFAALIVALVNVKTGDCYLCNAGDNIVHLYNSGENKMKQITLPESPASGVFPSFMVDGKFQQVKTRLEKGDALLLFTDGVEEAKRAFRNSKFEHITCAEPGMKDGDLHGNHYVSAGDEELGISRIYDIINAVFNKATYKLEKYHNPVPDELLTFDFSSCTGTMEEAIMAMVSVERIFRIIPDPTATADNRIVVDSKVNEFLKQHFDQYRRYFQMLLKILKTGSMLFLQT